MDVHVLLLLPVCVKEFTDCHFQIGICNERTSGLRSKADLAAESALSFPLIPKWLGIQHKIIFLFSSDVNTESESENMINWLCLSLEMMLRVRSVAYFCSEEGAFHWKSLFVIYFI